MQELDKLRELGIEVSTDKATILSKAYDNTKYCFLAEAIIQVRNAKDVSEVLKLANEKGISVAIRGSGTGCAGGALAKDSRWIIDLSKLDFIEIDPIARVAHVGAGAITHEIDKSAGEYALFYPPDPSSHKYSSIGGNIACNAGGLRAAKYGITREYVLALKAVLANGDILDCGLALPKFSVGPNLRDLFIGSEGTLGVVVEAWLKLLPKPKNRAVALLCFESDEMAFEGIEKILLAGMQPSILEFMDMESISCQKERLKGFIDKECAVLLAEFDNDNAQEYVNEFTRVLAGYDVRIADSDDEIEKFWTVRRACSPAMYKLGACKISQDIVIPIRNLREYFKYFKGLGKTYNLASPVFGHSFDGNYHIHFMYDENADVASNAMDLAIKKVIELGGAVSGEHGIGILKSKYMKYQHSGQYLEVLNKIKAVLDENNILNTGKLYVEHNLDEYCPDKNVHLPWDI